MGKGEDLKTVLGIKAIVLLYILYLLVAVLIMSFGFWVYLF
jgi:hypothetical protein